MSDDYQKPADSSPDVDNHRPTTSSSPSCEQDSPTDSQFIEIETIYQSAPVGLGVVDRSLRWLRVNEMLASINGLPIEAHIGRTLRDVVGTPLADRLEPLYQRVFDTGEPQLNIEIRGTVAADPGTIRDWQVSYHPLRDAYGAVVGVHAAVQDVTDRKRAEEERQRFATLIDQSNDCIGFSSLTGEALYINRATSRLLGVPRPDGMTPLMIAAMTAPEDQRMLAESVLPRVLAGGVWKGELRVRHAVTGEIIPLEQAVFPLVNTESGTVEYIATIARDVRERIEAENRLRRSETEFRSLFEASAVCNAEVDWPSGRIVRINARYCSLLGYDEAELLNGMSFKDVTHPDDWDRNVTVVNEFLSHNRDRFELDKRYICKNGQVIWVHLVGTVISRAGGGCRLLGSAVEITARRHAEEKIRASERRFQTATEAVAGFIYEIDVDLQQITFTIGVEHLLGLPSGEPMPLENWCGRVHAEDVTRVQQEWRDAVQGNGRSYRSEHRVRHRDGQHLDVWDNAVLVRDELGRVVRAIGHVIDISDRRRAEQNLLTADRKKNEFLAVLAHELRNPLAPIRNGLQIMKLAANNAVAVDQAQSVMTRQIDQMTRLVDDLMDVSRISQGRITVRKQRMALIEAIRNAVDSATPLLEANHHEFSLSLPTEPVWVDGDLLRLSQVFTNILNNAAKYTPRGGNIRLTLGHDSHWALVTVEDNGIGIPADMLSDVFEMFAQVDKSAEVSRGGLGLGLHIAKRLVEKHGGRIEVESGGVGKGSRFTVRLPVLADPSNRANATNPGEAAGSGNSRRVLVVDDNPDAATTLTMVLELMGNETRTAHDGLQAVALAESFRPHVILMDIGMPGLTGYDACRRIRDTSWGKTMVIVAQTGWGQDEDRRKASAAGFDSHLTKPIDLLRLEKLLANIPANGRDARSS